MTGGRLHSLDVFRGATVAAMILVNNPGSWSHVHPPLRHAPWHGWTPTDLIFPFFLFILGVAIPFSLERRAEASPGAFLGLILRVARRSLILVALGLLLAAWPFFGIDGVRLPGVLQRIGVVYLVAGTAALTLPKRWLLAFAAAGLGGTAAVLAFVPAPGGIPGDLAPGTNLPAWLDRLLIPGPLHQVTWDPEGALSTVPAIATALIGVFAGRLLRSEREAQRKLATLFAWGFALAAAGWAWDAWLPINKNLWTSSYALFTAGIACSCLGAAMLLTDFRTPPAWTRPFAAAGRNAILVFVGSGLLTKTISLFPAPGDASAYAWTWRTLFASWLGPLNGSLGFALANAALWLGVAAWLDRRGVRLKV